MTSELRVLMFGDVIGRLGRRAVAFALPSLKKKYKVDFTIANVENLAHGKGITPATLEELLQAGVDFGTSGNHIWAKPDVYTMFEDTKIPVLRPVNYPPMVNGKGHALVKVGDYQLLIVNVMGRVFMFQDCDDPFRAIDAVLEQCKNTELAGVIVDIHAEATSEKVAFGLYLDGRVSAVLGTHTHVPTADGEILPGGTACLSDIGMVGGQGTVIGVIKDAPIRGFLTQQPQAWDFPETGPCWVNAVCVTINTKSGQATKIQQIRELVEVV